MKYPKLIEQYLKLKAFGYIVGLSEYLSELKRLFSTYDDRFDDEGWYEKRLRKISRLMHRLKFTDEECRKLGPYAGKDEVSVIHEDLIYLDSHLHIK